MTGRKIAVIGSGISGLTAAYILARTDEVTIYEADGRLGGHADTHLVPRPGGSAIAADTGFIVYNERTYPLLTRLFNELGVTTQPSEMSMSVSCSGCGVEYAGKRGPAGLAAGLRHGGSRYLRMLEEVPRFHRAARRMLASGAPGELPLGDFLRAGRFSAYFTTHFAGPLVAAVWSCPPGVALQYPAGYLFAFLANHGMLSVSGSPQWRTVSGGSRCYVERIAARLAKVRLSSPVTSVRRHPDGVTVRDASGDTSDFDAAVIAAHPDQALRMLDAATPEERSVLGAFGYTPNPAVLHTDSRVLPARASLRASWNYSLRCTAGPGGPSPRISYYLNRLQGLPGATDCIVTLGEAGDIDPARRIATMRYAHPAYTRQSVAAQRRLPELNTGVTAFAGAYHGWGFHEDGCRSGAAAARALGGVW
ncbi:MAG TPA: FAD-dependent oxidoreductase [Trebonia sp.]|nr:FAD-dependent oxidoreductase [Trebonia sp.]